MSGKGPKRRSTESLDRLPRPTPTDGRTDGRTKNLQDQGDHLAYLDAHEKSGKFDTMDEPAASVETVANVWAELRRATQRAPVIRRADERAPLNWWTRAAVLDRDRARCQWCHNGGRLEVDHLIPWSAGGSNATDNLRTLCVTCNQIRSDQRADYAMARPLLVMTWCPRDSAGVESRNEDLAIEWGEADLEVPIYCLSCRGRSTVSRETARVERFRQHHLPPTWKDATE